MSDKKREKMGEVERPMPAKIDKAKAIMDSAMPEDQKMAYLREIGAVAKEDLTNKVGLDVYFTVKKIDRMCHGAMKVYPKAVGIRLATIEQWDEIFKDF